MELEEILQGIRNKDPQAVSALFEREGDRLYQAFYLASGDHGQARSQSQSAFSALLRRIRQAQEGTVTPAQLEQWLGELTAQQQELPPSRFSPASPQQEPQPDQPAPQSPSPLDLCLASFPEQPLPPETQRLLEPVPPVPEPVASPPPKEEVPPAAPPKEPPPPQPEASPVEEPPVSSPVKQRESAPEPLPPLQKTSEEPAPRKKWWSWLLLGALILVLIGLVWAIAGVCMTVGWLPKVDLGYSWFNAHIWPIFI